MRSPLSSSNGRTIPGASRRLVPWIVFGIFVVYLAASALPLAARPGGFDLAAFGRLPVWANGRVQTFDSVARTGFLQIRGPVTASLDTFKRPQARPATIDPTAWLLEVLAKPDAADTRRVFAIRDHELIGRLQLGVASSGTNYYAFDALGPKASEIQEHVRRIADVKAADRAGWQEELIALRDKLVLYERLKNSLMPSTRLQSDANGKPVTFDFAAQLAAYQTDLAEALRVDAGRRRGSTERLDVAAEMRIRAFAALFQVVSRTGVLAVIPAPKMTGASNHWSNLGSVVVQSAQGRQPSQPVAFFAGMSSAFAQGKPDSFNALLAQYRQWLAANGLAAEARKAAFEAFSNLLLPLARACALYAVALLLVGLAWRARSATAYGSALMVVLLASALHATGLLLATIVAGRPSWIAVSGWAVGLAALVVERFRRGGHGALASAAIGLTTLVAAYALAPGGAASLLRNVLDLGLAVAIGATVLVLPVRREPSAARRPATAPQAALENRVA
ncbi:MAG TPA: hypothetical protein VFP65_02320 [Anaeromyxobacteraceae bacterium]|nr:hypothetical protein [Anaeromyxobacteraceae bacterium]